MKISFYSDLHLEWLNSSNDVKPGTVLSTLLSLYDNDSDVIVIAGDFSDKLWHFEMLYEVASKPTILICGNHEYYDKNIKKFNRELDGIFEYHEKIFFLRHGSFTVIDNVKFVGATLWTDSIEREDSRMNDFRYIKKFSAAYWRKSHNYDIANIKKNAIRDDSNQKLVVVTHHSPSMKSFDGYSPMAYYGLRNRYASMNLEKDIENINADVWIHGHLHMSVEYHIKQTLVVSNPYGYHNYAANENFKPKGKQIEI